VQDFRLLVLLVLTLLRALKRGNNRPRTCASIMVGASRLLTVCVRAYEP
jgi:hypothetical protein